LAKLESAAISAEARAMLPLLAKATREHASFEPGDFAAARALGVSDEAIRDALYVSYLFNIINRMADALVFHVGSQASFDKSTKSLLGRGYR
jgi:alkylhydroperoxidase family enzyme